MFRSRLGLDALVSELAFLFLGVTLAVDGSPFSWVGFRAALCFFLYLSMASWADSLRASSNSLASSASSCPGNWEWVREWLLVNSSSSSSRALKCFLMNSEVSEDIFQGRVGRWFGCFWMQFGLGNDFGSIYLEQIMQRLAILAFIDLLQRAALTGYCSALLNLAPVIDVMQCSLVYLSLGFAYYLTMHI